MKLSMFEIFKKIRESKTEEEKIDILKKNDSSVLRSVLQYTYHPVVEWLLPAGAPPYKPNKEIGNEERFLMESRKLYLFVKEVPGLVKGNMNITLLKRESLFINFLEVIHEEDAKIVIQMKDRELKDVSSDLVKKAFPGLLPEGNLAIPKEFKDDGVEKVPPPFIDESSFPSIGEDEIERLVDIYENLDTPIYTAPPLSEPDVVLSIGSDILPGSMVPVKSSPGNIESAPPPVKKKRILSEETRQKMRDNMKRIRSLRKKNL